MIIMETAITVTVTVMSQAHLLIIFHGGLDT
jgi:hypothetical protein